MRGISHRLDPYAALGVPRDLSRSASDHLGDLEAKELPRRACNSGRCGLKSVRFSDVFRQLQASNAIQHFGTQGACVVKPGRAFPRLFAGLVVSLTLAIPAFGLETFTEEAQAQHH